MSAELLLFSFWLALARGREQEPGRASALLLVCVARAALGFVNSRSQVLFGGPLPATVTGLAGFW